MLLTVSVALFGAPTAGASVQLMIDGAGDGHGVGMSQTVPRAWPLFTAPPTGESSPTITRGPQSARCGQAEPFACCCEAASQRVPQRCERGRRGPLGVRVTYHATLAPDGRINLRLASGAVLALPLPLRVTSSIPITLLGAASSGVSDGRYDGSLLIAAGPGGRELEVINTLNIEDYVRGVVAMESPATWQPAELEAQAIASRTFALTAGPFNGGFDVYADSRSQVYGGVDAQTPSTDAAVAATTGQIVTYRGVAVITYFFASSGGRTADVQQAFAGSAAEPWFTPSPTLTTTLATAR